MLNSEKIAKIRQLAERGATEGERTAARAALERIEAAMPGITAVAEKQGVDWDPTFDQGHLSDEEVARIVNDAWHFVERSRKPSHHGRVWIDHS